MKKEEKKIKILERIIKKENFCMKCGSSKLRGNFFCFKCSYETLNTYSVLFAKIEYQIYLMIRLIEINEKKTAMFILENIKEQLETEQGKEVIEEMQTYV